MVAFSGLGWGHNWAGFWFDQAQSMAEISGLYGGVMEISNMSAAVLFFFFFFLGNFQNAQWTSIICNKKTRMEIGMEDPLPSARMLESWVRSHSGCFISFVFRLDSPWVYQANSYRGVHCHPQEYKWVGLRSFSRLFITELYFNLSLVVLGDVHRVVHTYML